MGRGASGFRRGTRLLGQGLVALFLAILAGCAGIGVGDRLVSVRMGKIGESGPSLGASFSEAAKILGKADSEFYFQGAYTLRYGQKTYSFAGFKENPGVLVLLGFASGSDAFGFRLGASAEEARAYFGKPDREIRASAGGEGLLDYLNLVYFRADAAFLISCDRQGRTSAAYLLFRERVEDFLR